MAKITYIGTTGAPEEVDADIGANLMSVAVDNMIDGIDGDCGGCISCATCHIYIDDAWLDKMEKATAEESALLEAVPGVRVTSRLGCQLLMTNQLDGLIVYIPET